MSEDMYGKPEGQQRLVKLSSSLIQTLEDYAYGDAPGGHQGFSREILERIEQGVLSFDDALIGKAWRYAYCYGEGGWQNVFKRVLESIRHPSEK